MTTEVLERADDWSASVVMKHGGTYYGSSASANRYNDAETWWLARVIVADSERRKGHGRELLERLCALLKPRGVKAIVVSPGGYTTPPEVQVAFYEACGFVQQQPGLWRRAL